ncbi:MAG TPA: hypothetical protein ENJ45_01440 [Phaeodactylibacter sp.]|nr:hypothetical protein [Phaeodactylibacter sp.]
MKLFTTAEIAKFSKEEFQQYQDSVKYYRDLKNSIDTAKEEGRKEERKNVALTLLAKGQPIDFIMEVTGLNRKQIEKLR